MSSQDQRSDLVDDLALFVGRPIAEVGDVVSAHVMTVTLVIRSRSWAGAISPCGLGRTVRLYVLHGSEAVYW